MRPPYLTGDGLTLRALAAADAATAMVWFPGPFPVGAHRAEAFLTEAYESGWYPDDVLYLAVVQLDNDRVVGGVAVEIQDRRVAYLTLKAAPGMAPTEAQVLRAAALRLLIPWLRDDFELMATTVDIPADEAELLAAATSLGMIQAVRLREHVVRPGGRVDVLQYQALNPRWAMRD